MQRTAETYQRIRRSERAAFDEMQSQVVEPIPSTRIILVAAKAEARYRAATRMHGPRYDRRMWLLTARSRWALFRDIQRERGETPIKPPRLEILLLPEEALTAQIQIVELCDNPDCPIHGKGAKGAARPFAIEQMNIPDCGDPDCMVHGTRPHNPSLN